MSVTKRRLLQCLEVTRTELYRTLQVLYGLLPSTLAPLDVSHQLKYPRVIGQRLLSYLEFDQSTFIITVSCVEIFCACEVRFAGIRAKTSGCFDCRLRVGETPGGMV